MFRIYSTIIVIFLYKYYFLFSYNSCYANNVNNGYDTKIINNSLDILQLQPAFYQFWDYSTPSADEIKHAFYKISLLYHPDKVKDNQYNEKYLLIRSAYDYLKG